MLYGPVLPRLWRDLLVGNEMELTIQIKKAMLEKNIKAANAFTIHKMGPEWGKNRDAQTRLETWDRPRKN